MFAHRMRGIVAALAIAGALVGTAGAQADPITTPLQPVPGAVDQQWNGHDRSMTLYYDGFGTLTLSSGAFDGETWNVQWRDNAPDPGYTITLLDRTAVYGAGLGDLVSGRSWSAGLVAAPDSGATILHFTVDLSSLSDPNAGYFWCSPTFGGSRYCGA